MRELSDFVKNEFAKKQLMENYTLIESIEGVDKIINALNCGLYMNIKFKTSNLKDYFIDKITTSRPESNIINCNCSIDSYFENQFNGLIIFNNINKCHYIEILEDINKYKKSIKVY
jgi:hypothetical protein